MNVFALERIEKTLATPKFKQELLKGTKLPERTLTYNLSILKKKGLIKEVPVFIDLRKKLFTLSEVKWVILMNEFTQKASIIKLEELKEHEKVDPKYLNVLKNQIKSDGILKKPIAVDKNFNIVLDGHHRLQSLKKLGYTRIPVVFIDYQPPAIQVLAWRGEEKITKEVISAALSGKKLPPKTSKHMIVVNGNLEDISTIEKEVNIPLEKLR
ncbi:MAG: ParB N-terminal domain-containing protein [Thermoprotei archaeon]